jgi:CelD/BcsL family acetyltransferase involved in cellulose biosynthesis
MAAVPTAELIVDASRLEQLAPQWDALAWTCARPMQSPAWLLAWLRHLAAAQVALRVVAVREGQELIGIAPFYVNLAAGGRIDYRMMGDAYPGSSPLCAPGCEREVAEAVAATLAAADPRADALALESTPLTPAWAKLLRGAWPGLLPAIAHTYQVQSSPTVALTAEDFESWLSRKSSNFRSQMRRIRRQFEQGGGHARIGTMATLDADLDAFMRLHASRWEGRGSSSIVAREELMRAQFHDVGRAHTESGRFRMWMLEIDGEPISAQLFLQAGGELLYMNGGWDERYAKFKPAILGIFYAIEDAFARGERRLDLAPGGQPYKLRFADGDDPVGWALVMLPGRRLPWTVTRSTPLFAKVAARETAKRLLPDASVERIRRIRRSRRIAGQAGAAGQTNPAGQAGQANPQDKPAQQDKPVKKPPQPERPSRSVE